MIKIKTEREIEIMAEGAHKCASILKELSFLVKPGITTKFLDQEAEKRIISVGAKPNFKGYGGYPATICSSINEQVVHTIPSSRVLQEGDIITIDIGLLWKGYNSDMAMTVPVGKVRPEVTRLIDATRGSLYAGIKEVKIGRTFSDVSRAIQSYAEKRGYFIIRDLCGHGIGKELHEDPQILNFWLPGPSPKIEKGMVFCLEPMISVGTSKVVEGEDGSSYVTADNSLSCHFEHEIAVDWSGEVRVLSKRPGEKIE